MNIRTIRGAVLLVALTTLTVGLAGATAGHADEADGPPIYSTIQPAVGPVKVAVILAKVGTADDPASPAAERAEMFDPATGLDAWLREDSAGAAWFADRTGAAGADFYSDPEGAPRHQWYTIPAPADPCPSGSQYYEYLDAAKSRAAQEDYVESDYRLTILVLPYGEQCGPQARGGWLGVITGEGLAAAPLAHEMGHAFGFFHAGSINCLSSDGRMVIPLSDNCNIYQYGDPYDAMGEGTSRGYSAWRKYELGWLPAANTAVATSSGTYTLTQSEYPVPGATQLISIPRHDTNGALIGWIQLEVRVPYGQFDQFARDGLPAGVLVRLSPYRYSDPGQASDTAIIETDPAHHAKPLQAGRTFVDVTGGLQVTTLSIADGVARVAISVNDGTRVQLTPGHLAITASAGVANNVRVTGSGSTLTVQDAGAPLLPGFGCTLSDPHTAVCKAKKRITSITADLRDGDDRARVDAKIATTFLGGDGNDWFQGSAAPDVFAGGPGDDTVDYTNRKAAVVATIGDGANDGQRNERDDVQADVEHVLIKAH